MPNSRSYNSDFTRSSVFIIYLIISKAFEEKSMWFTYFFAVFFFFGSKTEMVQWRLKSRSILFYIHVFNKYKIASS